MSSISKIFIASQRHAGVKEILQRLLPHLSFQVIKLSSFSADGIFKWDARLTHEDLEQMKDAEIVIGDNIYLSDVAFALPKLKWYQCTYAGLDGSLREIKHAMQEKGTPSFRASRFSGVKYGQFMFDYCLSFIIGHERGFLKHIQIQSKGDWQLGKSYTPKNPRLLNELTITVLGVGAIGSYVLKEFKRLGCKTQAFSRREKDKHFLQELQVDKFSTQLQDVLVESDCIVSILPQTLQTVNLLNGKLQMCQRQPMFINVGRGSIISRDDIISSLDNNFISCAVLDVFHEEPLLPSDPLWSHPKVFVTPHIAAETRDVDLAELFVQNLTLFENNRRLVNEIEWESDY